MVCVTLFLTSVALFCSVLVNTLYLCNYQLLMLPIHYVNSSSLSNDILQEFTTDIFQPYSLNPKRYGLPINALLIVLLQFKVTGSCPSNDPSAITFDAEVDGENLVARKEIPVELP